MWYRPCTLGTGHDNHELPAEVDVYHNLCPLETSPASKSSVSSFVTSVYKATNIKTGVHYCLRRIHGFRVTNPKCLSLLEIWKKMQHSNLVHLRECFTTKAFGDHLHLVQAMIVMLGRSWRLLLLIRSTGHYNHALVFVYDYHPGADTLMNLYFNNQGLNSTAAPHMNGFLYSSTDTMSTSFSQNKGLNSLRQHAGLLPESLIWAYVVQLSSVLRTIHAAGLACRTIEPSKILITAKSRLRLNCCAIYDVLNFDVNQANPKAVVLHYQQEDLIMFGKVVLALACNSLAAIQRSNHPLSMELISRNYSADLKNLIMWVDGHLCTNQQRPRSINDIMPMIGARFYTQLDAAHLRSDVIELELAKNASAFVIKTGSTTQWQATDLAPKEMAASDMRNRCHEVQNGRMFRMLCKLGAINERQEFNMDPAWSETGDRYPLKLFRDYLFHQVAEDGRPWLDLAHLVYTLNKLDAGSPEKICLMSRDEHNVLIVSYTELKQCFESAFGELQAAAVSKPNS
ncbi:PAN3 [Cordylochernes scorpioides]|uniref:PAN3 n=1 Tax=Cordylochernes scorpioides TaxID=51811 RepID=A0ABY6LVH5_9ARAC|nr:PAN3 [Cordylochernes scorpioides]